MKLCKDCKHYRPGEFPSIGVSGDKCVRWPSPGVEPVRGTPKPAHETWCYYERRSDWWEARRDSECGKEGRYWEAK